MATQAFLRAIRHVAGRREADAARGVLLAA
jgi:hypothetical protein